MSGRPEPVRDLDWTAARTNAILENAAGLVEELLVSLRDRPVSPRQTAGEVRAAVLREVPDEPLPDAELLAHLRTIVLERSTLTGHPRFMAYISGAGTVPGVAADLVAAGLNANVGGWFLSPAATEIELALGRFFAQDVFGLPETAGGYVTSGGAMASYVALKAARDHCAGWDVRAEGLAGHPQLAVYLSTETHVVSDRAADMLGLGREGVRHVPVDGSHRLDASSLRDSIGRDRAAGVVPVAVVATAGTVSTGAIDPLEQIADVCADEGLWLHVDAAYGGPALLADDLRPLFRGIERADSIAFDPHKWLYTPLTGGFVVVRDLSHLAEAFDFAEAAYVHQDKEWTQQGLDLGRFGPQFSRGFWALKIWLSLLAHGRRAYARRISHDAALARYLGELVEERPDFELCAPVGLSITCFRYVPPDLGERPDREGYLDRLNERLMAEIQTDGRAYCSNAVLSGRFVLRSCIVNFRTEAEDVEALLEVAAELGERLDRELREGP
jgi:glutamate/tyrosine decarboxylase-like PLP-dependent enzyme